MCFLAPNAPICRRRTKFVLLIALLVWLNANAVHADELDVMQDQATLVKWAITQGGPAVLVIVLGWSYRRDLLGVIARRTDEVSASWEQNRIMVELIQQTSKTNERLTAAVEALTIEVRRFESK